WGGRTGRLEQATAAASGALAAAGWPARPGPRSGISVSPCYRISYPMLRHVSQPPLPRSVRGFYHATVSEPLAPNWAPGIAPERRRPADRGPRSPPVLSPMSTRKKEVILV